MVGPEDIWDCHAHHFGPLERYPAIAERGYEPPAVERTDYLAKAQEAGVTTTVWVQPSIYGADNTALDDLLALRPKGTRAVIAPPQSASAAQMRSLHELGVRGLRLNLVSKGGNAIETVTPYAQHMRELGWHVAAFVDATNDEALDRVMAAFNVPVVVDHFGYAGNAMPQLDGRSAFSRHLESGRLWVKLSAPYQIDPGTNGSDAAASLAAGLLARAPDRLLFGSNWPHIGLREPPTVNFAKSLVATWSERAGVDARQIFSTNPAALYA
jgi:2-pyrone-4,6-dicarboxylate lactonase